MAPGSVTLLPLGASSGFAGSVPAVDGAFGIVLAPAILGGWPGSSGLAGRLPDVSGAFGRCGAAGTAGTPGLAPKSATAPEVASRWVRVSISPLQGPACA